MATQEAEPFVWGANGAVLTPDQVAMRRKMAMALRERSMDTSPVQHWAQGLARVMSGLAASRQEQFADEDAAAGRAADGKAQELGWAALMGQPAGAAGAPAAQAAPVPAVARQPDPGPTYVDPKVAALPKGTDSLSSGQDALWQQQQGETVPALASARARYAAELADPAIAARLAALTHAEVGGQGPQAQQAFMESTLNRAAARNQSLADTMTGSYFPAVTHERTARFAADPAIARQYGPMVQAVMGGSNAARFGTGNASGQVGFAGGPQVAAYGGERFGIEGPDQKWATGMQGDQPSGRQQVAQALMAGQQGAPAQAGSRYSPELIAAVKAAGSPWASAGTKMIAQALMQQQMRPRDFGFQALPDGTILRTDPRKGTVEPVYQSQAKPQSVGQNDRLVDPATGRVILDAAPGYGETRDANGNPIAYLKNDPSKTVNIGAPTGKAPDVADLRKEVQQLPSYKNYKQAEPIMKSMLDTVGTDSKASDLNLVYGLGKIMDPTSVVREGEMVMVKDTAALPDWLVGQINGLNGGARLQADTRRAMVREAASRFAAYRTALDTDMGQFRGIVERGRINPLDVLPAIDPSITEALDAFGRATPPPARTGQEVEMAPPVVPPQMTPGQLTQPQMTQPQLTPGQGGQEPVRVQTPEEAMKLPPGTRFVNPAGEVLVVPGRRQ